MNMRVVATLPQQLRIKELLEQHSTERADGFRAFEEGWNLDRVATEAGPNLNRSHARHVAKQFGFRFHTSAPGRSAEVDALRQAVAGCEDNILTLLERTEGLADMSALNTRISAIEARLDTLEAYVDEEKLTDGDGKEPFFTWAARTLPAKTGLERRFKYWCGDRFKAGDVARNRLDVKRLINATGRRDERPDLHAVSDAAWSAYVIYRNS